MSLFLLTPGILKAEIIDSDNDGLSDADEALYYTDSNNPDTDGDTYTDGIEVKHGYSPHAGPGVQMHQYDYDKDKLDDWLEGWFHADRGKGDTDGDGDSDFDEVMRGYSPSEKNGESKFRRWIEVDLPKQRLYYFVDRVKILNLPVSTGNPGTETPDGMFEIMNKIPVKRYTGVGYDLPDVKWNMEFKKGGYYIHGSYWHNDFGLRTHSHGCINMRTEDAGLLYMYTDVGMPVHITGETPKKRNVGT
ncbi:MAG: hypothetical protein A2479_03105 [Candidatus Magasanikbacteria bacterium RIFOXYC2_FULL_39_8]|nr:MAG: hypothetical protein A2479_03105 [Candidatus Magasanikbacteria bacterium RIFOXYC2_FULL_39_8]